jgi:hypothetical protein
MALMAKNLKKITAEKKLNFFLDRKTTIYLSLGLHKELLLFVIFALLGPDSESRSGSTDPIESGSSWDPDPQPCI